MDISDSTLLSAWNTIISIGGTIVAYVVKCIKSDIKDASKKADSNELSIANHKTHVSENYCDKQTMQNTLERIHDRIDTMSLDLKDLLKEIAKK